MAISWSKLWGAADDGLVFTGAHLRALQDDISQQVVYLNTVPLTDGLVYWTGSVYSTTTTLPSTVTVSVSQVQDFVFCDGDLISWEDEIVYSI